MSSPYRVHLQLFDGPLDLLLYLVRRNELNVLELRVSEIAAQFAAYLDVLEFIDLDLVGEFLVMASTLMEIKSREALPQQTDVEEPAPETTADPRSSLIQQLLEYKKYKDAAKALEERAAEWQQRFPRLSNEHPQSGKDPASDFIKQVELWDLVSALSRVLRKNAAEQESRIRYDETPIATWMDRISSRVLVEGRTPFSTLFVRESQRSRIVGLFLALLELIRHHGYRAEQPSDFGEIWILPPAESVGGSIAPPEPAPANTRKSAA